MRNLKHLKTFESFDTNSLNEAKSALAKRWGGDDESEDFVYSYFIETYINGNFSQLRKMLTDIKQSKKLSTLNAVIKSDGGKYEQEIIDWIDKNTTNDKPDTKKTLNLAKRWGGDDESEDFVYSYFIDTYINGNFSQLRKMLTDIVAAKKLSALKSVIKNAGGEYEQEIIDWVDDNQ